MSIPEDKAKGNYTEEEVHTFITIGNQLALKPLMSLISKLIAENTRAESEDSVGEGERLLIMIAGKTPAENPKCLQCEFTETPYKLNILLSIVNNTYKTEIDIPDVAYAADLMQKYNFLKNIAIACWRQFAEENVDLYRRICDFCAGTDFTSLNIDEHNPTTLFFNKNSAVRLGIFCYYINEKGEPFMKRNSKNKLK